jgi:4'-phosphopantetheinyl transferase
MKIYVSNIRPQMALSGIELVTESRKKRIGAYIRAGDKARCLTAGLLLRQFCGVTDDSQLYYGENGKPYLKYPIVPSPGVANELPDALRFFNISHSGDYAALAVSDREVGIDIEKTALYSEAAAARCFSPEEREWMNSQDGSFSRIWTAKESLMKAIGTGFSLSPSSFCVLPIDSSAHEILGRRWFFDWHTFDGYIICRVIEDKDEETEIVRMC